MDNNKINESEIHEKPVMDSNRREALIKLGKYSAGATVASFTLSSRAQSGTHHGGWGNHGGRGNRRPNRHHNNRRWWWQRWF